MMNKKAILYETVIYLLLGVIVFFSLFFFIIRVGSGGSFYEQAYAKQIALLIDKSKPNVTIKLDVSKLYELAEKNNYRGKIININNLENIVSVKVSESKGYRFNFFNARDIIWKVDEKKGKEKLFIEVR